MFYKKIGISMMMLFIVVVFAACGQRNGEERVETEPTERIEGKSTEKSAPYEDEKAEESSVSNETENEEEESTVSSPKQQFGENCMEEQTFEVQLSEYEKKVWFVSYAPTEQNSDVSMQIVSEGETLAEISPYVPQSLSGEKFGSLDAVSFYDVNYDGNTDIVLIETYGNTSFAAVYYGYNGNEAGEKAFFVIQETLSENISAKLNDITIPAIRTLLSDGKKNGEFTDYKEAYEIVSRLCALESSDEIKYNLIYVNEDDIPELAVGNSGYFMSLYTWSDGSVYTLMDHWGYGAMGNAGYEYSPRKNSVRNDNSDYAGAILYRTYMKINESHVLDTVVQIESYQFDDVNQNGIPDENEMDSIGRYSVNYIGGKEITDETYQSYDMGDYEYIEVHMTPEDLKSNLIL